MRRNLALPIASLLSILLTTFHLTHDALHMSEGMPLSSVAIIVVFMLTMLYGTVELWDRRAGYVIMFFGGLLAAWMPFLHGVGPRATRWGFFFVWTLFALGATGAFTALLALQAFWRSFRVPAISRT